MTYATNTAEITENIIITANVPKGWYITDEQDEQIAQQRTRKDADMTAYLPIAAERALHVVDELQVRMSINVPEAYMKVEENIFHILLLIDQADFFSPKKSAARMIIDNYAKSETRFDMKFTFTNRNENIHKATILDNGYLLKHVEADVDARNTTPAPRYAAFTFLPTAL